MDKIAQIKKNLIEVVGIKPNLPITATVVQVINDHCKVRLTSGLELTDVKLKATINQDQDYLLLTPVIGSKVVLISLTGDLNNLTILKVDQIEKIELKQNGLTLLVDGNDSKISVKNELVSFKEILTDLAALLKQLKVFTPVGASGTPLPDSIAAITQFENKFNQLLK